jgi:hypothetical protein
MTQQIPWTRVLIEGVVIVGSILLAFGIDAWWETQQEEGTARDYVVRIEADLRETRANIDQSVAQYANVLAHSRAILPILNGAEALPQDTLGFLASALQASRITEPIVARSAYDDLISTGNLRIIRDDALRYELSRFYANVGVQLDPVDYEGDQKPYRAVVRSTIPLDVQLLIRERCLDSEPLTCAAEDVPEGLGDVARSLTAEPGLVRMLTFSMQAKATRIGFVLDRGGFSGGFGVVARNIDELLELVR